MAFKFAPNLSTMFHENEYIPQRYKSAANCGFLGVECQDVSEYGPVELAISKEEAAVEQVLINTTGGTEFGHANEPGHIFQRDLTETLRYARYLKCKKIHILAGLKRPDSTFEEMEKNYLSNLVKAAEMCEKANVIGVIEPLCDDVKPNYFLCSFEKALDYVKRINSEHLKLLMDVYHLQMISGNLTNTIKSSFPYIGHVQISQAPYRNEPFEMGEINYTYVLCLLSSLGYDDWIGLEYFPSGATQDCFRWIEEYGYKRN